MANKTTGNKKIKKGVSGCCPKQSSDCKSPKHYTYPDQNNSGLMAGSNKKAGQVTGRAPNQLTG